MCRLGEDIILVTLNHMDTIRDMLGGSQCHVSMLDSATKTLVDVSDICVLLLVGCSLLVCFQLIFLLLSAYNYSHGHVVT